MVVSKVKQFLIMAILIAAIPDSTWSRSISSMNIGGFHIYNDGKTVVCDTLKCPNNTDRCVISKNNDEKDPTKIVTWKRCIDSNNTIVMEDREQNGTAYPGEIVNLYLDIGNDQSYSTLSSEEVKRLQKEIWDNVNESMANLRKELESLTNRFPFF